MTFRRLVNVLYALLVDALGGTQEAREEVDAILASVTDPAARAEHDRRRKARENAAAFAALQEAFAAG